MEILSYLRDRLSGFTIEGSIPLLRRLGSFDIDAVVVLTTKGYRNIPVWELVKHYNGTVPVDRLRFVYFWGGPTMTKQYKGDYLTFLVDRAMYAVCELGWTCVNVIISHSEGEGPCSRIKQS